MSNNPYEGGDIAGLGRRARLDAGILGVVAVTVNSALQAVMLLRGAKGQGLTVLTAEEVVVDAEAPEIPVGIDGETVMMPTPVRLHHPAEGAAGPGAPPPARRLAPRPRPPLDWPALAKLASFRS